MPINYVDDTPENQAKVDTFLALIRPMMASIYDVLLKVELLVQEWGMMLLIRSSVRWNA